MGIPKRKEGTFSYADYRSWPDEERWELIHGVAYDMSPAPGSRHQEVLGTIFRRIADVTDSMPCRTYVAPFDVRLSEEARSAASDDGADTVVQPDISVFCDRSLIDERGAHGAPDLVVEVLSPTTAHKDQTEKLRLYERVGVKEYWIVNAEAEYVMVYRRDPSRGFKKPDYYRGEDEVASDVLDRSFPLPSFFRQ